MLVADDQVVLSRSGAAVLAQSPDAIRGKIEVRGVGIVQVKHVLEAEIVALVDLVAPHEVERMPEPPREEVLGVSLPVFRLTPFEASAPIKLAAVIALSRKL